MIGLAFDEKTHTYRFGNQKVPNVTDILRPLYDFDRVPPAALELARIRGSRVHRAIRAFELGRFSLALAEEQNISGYLAAYMKFKLENPVEVLAVEKQVYSKKMGYAGTLDIEALYFRKPSIFDVKTCFDLQPEVGPQTAGYKYARAEEDATPLQRHRYALYLHGDGTYNVVLLDKPDDLDAFFNCLAIYKWKQKYRG